MEKADGLVDFYKRKLIRVPDSIHNEMGHFDLFKLDPYVGSNARPIPYKRRDYYKIMLVEGPGKVHYANRVVQVQKQALSFSNPQIPYKWEHTEDIKSGFFVFSTNIFLINMGIWTSIRFFIPQETTFLNFPTNS